MAATMVSSAGGLLAMLNETHPSLKLHALSNLNNLVDNFWPEISTSVPIMYFLSFSLQLSVLAWISLWLGFRFLLLSICRFRKLNVWTLFPIVYWILCFPCRSGFSLWKKKIKSCKSLNLLPSNPTFNLILIFWLYD